MPCLSRRDILKAGAVYAAFPFVQPSSPHSAIPIFSDITEAAGVNWKHFSGESSERLLIETMGGGVGLMDTEGSGSLDIFLLNGGETPRGRSSKPIRNALYRNTGNWKFQDVAQEAGLHHFSGYGMGVSIADFDNDGRQDLFITGFPRCALFHNNGNGTFSDVTKDAGVENAGRWATGSAWFDYDNDGYLDLIVCNYVKFSLTGPQPDCEYSGVRTYCEQRGYEGMSLTLYRNNRNGTFSDVSHESGLDQLVGRALGVVAIDVNGDGWQDLFISRDGSSNLLLINQRNGTFVDLALEAEVAYDSAGNAKAGMGIDAGDCDGDGYPDFVVTNFNNEFDSLFLNSGRFPFTDASRTSRLAAASRFDVGWGVRFIDYDNDGRLDLLIVNGHINEVIELAQPAVKFREHPLLLRNVGNAAFEDVTAAAGTAFKNRFTARGLATGDLDNDGATDAVFTCAGGSPVLLRNNVGRRNAWLGIKLIGTKSNHDGIGAKLVLTARGQKITHWIYSGGSYLSSHDKRVVFGLKDLSPRERLDVEIHWPGTGRQVERSLEINRYHTITEAKAAGTES
ncbi:MAG: CRTAC1 family protein [Acidobacteriaceae bacterium]|nr:CRTAC1 family protein [Acidobacteriaceae bacterium]